MQIECETGSSQLETVRSQAKGDRATKAAATRLQLISAARKLFAQQGFHGTGTHEIVLLAGVSRGALQHHFARKEDLFRAVFEAVGSDMAEPAMRGQQSRAAGGRWENLKEHIESYLESATTPEVQRIILIDGPAVLGWAEWRSLQARTGLDIIEDAVVDGIEAGLIRRQNPEALANLILSLIGEAALLVANAPASDSARQDTKVALDTMLSSLV